jgi:hypothetical protein
VAYNADSQPYIEVKKARIARAGKQIYSASEIAARGMSMASDKPFYVEYRPPEVVLKNLSKFNNVPFVNDHAPVDLTPDNWKDYAIGFVGSNAGVEVTDDGEIFVTNDVVFYDRKAYEDYQAGKRQLSAGYDLTCEAVKDAEKAGYDLVLTGIPAVNHVALCDCARAGPNARVLDSVDNSVDKILGGYDMGKVSILSRLGIGKAKDAAFSFSKVLFESVAKMGTLDEAALKGEIDSVMAHVTPLGDGQMKEALVSAVADSFKHPVEVLAKKEAVAQTVDGLYRKCLEEDEKTAAAIQDALKEGEKDDEKKDEKEDEKKDEKKADAKDVAAVIDEAVKAAVSNITDSLKKDISTMVDDIVKDALGTKGVVAPPSGGSAVEDSMEDFDVSDLARTAWGRR